MQKISAGLLMFRKRKGEIEFFLVHPGGPFWRDKDDGAWSIPKGEAEEENFLETAMREFWEEVGIKIDKNKTDFLFLGEVRQKSGKIVHCWAFEDKTNLWKGFFMRQNFIKIEWPPKSGKKIKIPEVDKAYYFNLKTASKKINSEQKEFLERLIEKLKSI
jgi:predicted NUDIX family NTP pyrophosphohydrolase